MKKGIIIENLDIIFIVLGTIIMGSVLVWGGRVLGTRSIKLDSDKLGLKLAMDSLTLIFILGFALTGSSLFFRYQNYELKVSELSRQLTETDKTLKALNAQLDRFKTHELGVYLDFPRTINPQSLEIKVLKKSDGKGFIPTDVEAEHVIGGTWVHLNNLRYGEVIKIIAKDSSHRTFTCPDIKIPNTKVSMELQ